MTWNETVLSSPQLSSTDKLVYHLLDRLGDDSPQSRHQLSTLLGLGQRQLRRSRERLQSHGFLARSSVTAPVAPAVIHDRTADISDRETVIHDRSSNAYARTPSTSSSEEVTTLPAFQEGRKEKLAVPEAEPAEGEFSAQFSACWQDLAPGCAPPSRHQLKALQKDVGGQLPLTVARYFLMAGRSLSGLKNPDKAWNYFCRACLSEARTGRFLVQASPTEPSPPPAPTNRSLAELYLQKRSRA